MQHNGKKTPQQSTTKRNKAQEHTMKHMKTQQKTTKQIETKMKQNTYKESPSKFCAVRVSALKGSVFPRLKVCLFAVKTIFQAKEKQLTPAND